MSMLTNVLLLVIIAGMAAGGVVLCSAIVQARRKVRQIEDSLRTFVSAPDAQTPSPLAQTVDAAAQLMARAVLAQAKTTIMGMNSGAVRGERAAQVAETTAKFPWLKVLQQLSPQLSGTLVRNPGLLNLAAQFLQSRGGPAPPGSPPVQTQPPAGNGRVQAPLFKL